jgi:hypothetical protein
VAVLVVAEPAEISDVKNNGDFWNDTVLVYCMLRDNDFKEEDIYVLYGDGNDGMVFPAGYQSPPGPDQYYQPPYCENEEWNTKITDFPMTVTLRTSGGSPEDIREIACDEDQNSNWNCRPKDIFECLAQGCTSAEVKDRFECTDTDCNTAEIPALEEDDLLLVWWKGHSNLTHFTIGATDALPHRQVSEWTKAIDARHRVFLFETCRSGSLADPNKKFFGRESESSENQIIPIVLASCQVNGDSASDDYHGGPDHLHSIWSFWAAGTLRGTLPDVAKNPLEEKGDTCVPPVPAGLTECPTPSPGQASLHIELPHGDELFESFCEARRATMCQRGMNYLETWYFQTPVMMDEAGMAQHTRIDASEPGEETEEQEQQSQHGER